MSQPVVAKSSSLTLVLSVTVPVSSLTEARAKVAAFVRAHAITAANYSDAMGRVERDGVPYARVSFHGRLWWLDASGKETFREMDDSGRVAP